MIGKHWFLKKSITLRTSLSNQAYEGELLDEDERLELEQPTIADDGETGVGGSFVKYLKPQMKLKYFRFTAYMYFGDDFLKGYIVYF